MDPNAQAIPPWCLHAGRLIDGRHWTDRLLMSWQLRCCSHSRGYICSLDGTWTANIGGYGHAGGSAYGRCIHSPRYKRSPNHIGVQSPLKCAIPGRTRTYTERRQSACGGSVSCVVGPQRTRRGGLSHKLHRSRLGRSRHSQLHQPSLSSTTTNHPLAGLPNRIGQRDAQRSERKCSQWQKLSWKRNSEQRANFTQNLLPPIRACSWCLYYE